MNIVDGYFIGLALKKDFEMDPMQKWRTVQNGNNKSKHYIIETETGEIKGGLGGKLNGQKAGSQNALTSLKNNQQGINSLTNKPYSAMISKEDIRIPHSIGASSRISHEPIDVPGYDFKAYFVEGTRIQNVEVIAGKGKKRKIDDIRRLLREYPETNDADWEKVKGIGTVSCAGEIHKAEVHWYHSNEIGGIEYKIKIQKSGDVWLDED